MHKRAVTHLTAIFLTAMTLACSPEQTKPNVAAASAQPSILLITLDTTRADSMGFESDEVETPALEALAARGMRFEQAWTTAPMTLPSHTSMLTGLYPSEHGIRENSRFLDEKRVVLAERLRDAGFSTAAFVSGYPLKRRFGLARGFDHYDDDLGQGHAERLAGPTTDRALSYLQSHPDDLLFIWVHYFDPHEPYAPPEPFRSRYPTSPYLGEVASMDHEVGRLIEAFERRNTGRPSKILVAGDHGEGLGEHGEVLHGNLLYQGVMRVPLILAGSGIPTAVVETPVSTRRIFHTILGWAGIDTAYDLVTAEPEIVLAEALKPHLQYGWQPQVMAVSGSIKVMQSGETEVYDVRSDLSESVDLSESIEIDPEITQAISRYSLPGLDDTPTPGALDQEAREQLATLGYVGWEGSPTYRENAPNPKDMAHLFDDLDRGSALFVRKEYEASIEVFEHVLAEDSENLMVTVRLAVSHSILGNQGRAMELFDRAHQIQPESIDLQHYLAMHHFRFRQWQLAGPLFEKVLIAMPRRLPALEALARIRESQDRLEDAARLVKRTIALKEQPDAEWVRLGELEMAIGNTPAAIHAFEKGQNLQAQAFDHSLELGVLYLAAGRPGPAADALDRVPPDHPGYAMALFKRAQAAVLLGDPGWRERVRFATDRADPAIRRMIEREPLFQGNPPR
ncbi:MAG: sulfatase-like hydrolase/transferase [Acidobacteriota bacterium]